MKMEVTRDRCPICGETEQIERDMFNMTLCHCQSCKATWNYGSEEVWGYDRNGKKTAAQAAIDAKKQGRRDATKKYKI
jgi:hypothetical protein